MTPPPDDDDSIHRKNLIVLGVVILLVAFSVWLLLEFRHSSELMDCYAQGRKNCDSTEVPQ